MEQFLSRFQKVVNTPFFVQIGANDGKSGDPIHRYSLRSTWRGVLVEPIPYLFDALKQNKQHAKGKLVFENVAISAAFETKPFYSISDENDELPAWAKGINSLNKEHLLWQKQHFPDIESYIVETQVDCIPLESLLNRNNVTHIDLLLIDVEGYDYHILNQLAQQSIRPTVVIYEFQCLGDDIANARKLMETLGYACFDCGGDVIAIRKDESSVFHELLQCFK